MVANAEPDHRTVALERLALERRTIQARLEELGRHIGLTSAEKLEYAELKKRKLATKDLILALESR